LSERRFGKVRTVSRLFERMRSTRGSVPSVPNERVTKESLFRSFRSSPFFLAHVNEAIWTSQLPLVLVELSLGALSSCDCFPLTWHRLLLTKRKGRERTASHNLSLQLRFVPPPVHVLNVEHRDRRARSVDETLRVRPPLPHFGEFRVEFAFEQVLDHPANRRKELNEERGLLIRR
jgi:hypothetical protein